MEMHIETYMTLLTNVTPINLTKFKNRSLTCSTSEPLKVALLGNNVLPDVTGEEELIEEWAGSLIQ